MIHVERITGHVVTALMLSSATVSVVHAQASQVNAAEAMAAGDRESAAHRSAPALAHYEAAIARDSTLAQARWKAAGEAVTLGEAATEDKTRKAYYERAVAHAQKAVQLAPNEAEANFHMSRAVGRMALSVGPRDRVKYGKDVRSYAMRALELDPRHAGALHVLGMWHAEVMRLNSVTRAVARAFLGGQVFSTASWAEAARLLEAAVAVEPRRTVHHLDLARIYRDMGRKADARREFEAAINAPMMDASDPLFKRQAAEELRAMK